MRKSNFFSQTSILISRYLKIFFNDKQGLGLTFAIPILTIIIVAIVASGDMFCNVVENNINDGYPLLSWEMVKYEDSLDEDDEEDNKDENFKKWDGIIPQQPQLVPLDEDGNEYSINSPGDLMFIAVAKGDWLKKTYYLNCDIDMAGKTITPIGTKDEPFTGCFYGNGHIIRNLVIEAKSDNIGLFGFVKGEDTKICSFGIEKSKIKKSDSCENVGFIVGCLDGATVESCYVKTSSIEINGNNVGGVVGKMYGSKNTAIKNCYYHSDITVSGENVGGIVGNISAGSINYTYYAGTLSHPSDKDSSKNFGAIAGFVGEETFENLKKCIYDKDITKDYSAIGNTTKENKYTFFKNDVTGWSTKKLQENASLIKSLEKHLTKDETNGNLKNDGELYDFTGTQIGIFMLVCVAIFVGICNSIQEICKERNILKREYMTNLRLSAYITSKLAVQGLVCAVQIFLIMIIFFISVCKKDYPSSGALLGATFIEMYITLFLVAFAADTTALLVSSIVKDSSTANTFIPIILIVQIVFSGVLFDLGKAMDIIATFMISKWGIAALSATCHLNEGRLDILLKNPELSLQMADSISESKDLFISTPSNLLSIWAILLVFIFVPAILSGILLTRVKKDKR